MAERSFYRPEARAKVTQVIKDVEALTSAELVVALRHASGHYRHTDYLVGFVLALATLVAMLFLPYPFALWSFPVDVAVVFALGALATARSFAFRRLLTSPSLKRANVERAARAALVEMGVTKTTGRTGVLVFVSLFERRAEVVVDVGVDVAAMGAAWQTATRRIADSVAAGADFESFAEALRALGPILGAALPRQADDVNELPDEMVAS